MDIMKYSITGEWSKRIIHIEIGFILNWSFEMSSSWGLLPLGMDESDLMMLILAILILSILVIAMFIVFPWYYAVLATLFVIFGILYGVRELKQKQEPSG